jgi:DNA-binding response OmpR family regulator
MRPRRVLLVEDDPHYSDLLTHLLTSAGYSVTALDSTLGTQAQVVRLRPHAIVLDLGLPFRSGVSLLADLKADPQTADIPVLVISGQPEVLTPKWREMVTAVFAKPLELGSLLAAVRAACDTARNR